MQRRFRISRNRGCLDWRGVCLRVGRWIWWGRSWDWRFMRSLLDGSFSVTCLMRINSLSVGRNRLVTPHPPLPLCTEERADRVGTGSNHIREKDGLWAIVAWLNIIAAVDAKSSSKGVTTITTILQDFWKTYGRTFFSRYDYESIESAKAQKVIDLVTRYCVTDKSKFIGNDQ